MSLSFPALIKKVQSDSLLKYKGYSFTWSGEINLIEREYITVRILANTRTHDTTIHLEHRHRLRLRKAKVGWRIKFVAQLVDVNDGLLGPETEMVMDRILRLGLSAPEVTRIPTRPIITQPEPRKTVPKLNPLARYQTLVRSLRAGDSFGTYRGKTVSWKGTVVKRLRSKLLVRPAGETSGSQLVLRFTKRTRRKLRGIRRGSTIRFSAVLLHHSAKSHRLTLTLMSIH